MSEIHPIEVVTDGLIHEGTLNALLTATRGWITKPLGPEFVIALFEGFRQNVGKMMR